MSKLQESDFCDLYIKKNKRSLMWKYVGQKKGDPMEDIYFCLLCVRENKKKCWRKSGNRNSCLKKHLLTAHNINLNVVDASTFNDTIEEDLGEFANVLLNSPTLSPHYPNTPEMPRKINLSKTPSPKVAQIVPVPQTPEQLPQQYEKRQVHSLAPISIESSRSKEDKILRIKKFGEYMVETMIAKDIPEAKQIKLECSILKQILLIT
ncbi:uncharacterized protein LOC129613016 [Condylostylus longicornis]|uniref:uncharacterized protein LOC129613016 n=1 Tax=Condylostylus longicornis TaxID=2530218 RepID=UPI00244DC630|nr:uncharacterized protein LOC129613016 [Condylostylus longicornis]